MDYFLVTVSYGTSEYMSEEPDERHTKLHLVQAINEDEAKQKARKLYEDKTSEYSIYYYVEDVSVNETIK